MVALISDDDARKIVWKEDVDDVVLFDPDNDDTDRMFTFEVTKTREQDETVTARPGFSVRRPKHADIVLLR